MIIVRASAHAYGSAVVAALGANVAGDDNCDVVSTMFPHAKRISEACSHSPPFGRVGRMFPFFTRAYGQPFLLSIRIGDAIKNRQTDKHIRVVAIS